MNKRLRKKKHRGEFTEWGQRLVVTRKRRDGFDEFLDVFIKEAIEANGCSIGGAGMADELKVGVLLGRRSGNPAVRMGAITAWLGARPDVRAWRASAEVDMWHGDYDRIATEMEAPPHGDRD